MTIPDPAIKEKWDIVAYEAKMFFELCVVLSDPATTPKNEVVKNAVVESVCLHTRILIDFLISKKSTPKKGDDIQRDDIRLDDLLPGFTPPSLDKLLAAYGGARTEQSPCWILNKMIAHPTTKRGTRYDYTRVIGQLYPLIEKVWQEIKDHKQAVPAILPQSPGVLALTFSGTTSS
jgi:hypothetical protein